MTVLYKECMVSLMRFAIEVLHDSRQSTLWYRSGYTREVNVKQPSDRALQICSASQTGYIQGPCWIDDIISL